MPSKSVNIRPEHTRLWSRAQAVAHRRQVSLSTAVAEALHLWLDKHDPGGPRTPTD